MTILSDIGTNEKKAEKEKDKISGTKPGLKSEEKVFHWTFGLYEFMHNLYSKYDNSFLIVQGLVFFYHGFRLFLDLSVKDLFKEYLHLEPN